MKHNKQTSDNSKGHKFINDTSAKNVSPLPEFTPVSQGAQTQYGNNRWVVYSPKLDRNVTLYSDLEYDHWFLIEANPEIVTFCEQPLKITINFPLKVVSSIFDMWIQWKSGLQEFREVKFQRELSNRDSKSRVHNQIKAQKIWCESKGIKHTVVTDLIIRRHPFYLSNIKVILRYLSSSFNSINNDQLEEIKSLFPHQKQLSLGGLEKCFQSKNVKVRALIFKLILTGEIKAIDLHLRHLDKQTLLERVNA